MHFIGINKLNYLIFFFKDSHNNEITDSNKIANNVNELFFFYKYWY